MVELQALKQMMHQRSGHWLQTEDVANESKESSISTVRLSKINEQNVIKTAVTTSVHGRLLRWTRNRCFGP